MVIISILISAKPDGLFKIPNPEVLADWGRWVSTAMMAPDANSTDIIGECVAGSITAFARHWPDFMQQNLDPKIVAKARGATSSKTPERIYHAYLHGLLYSLGGRGWEVIIEARSGASVVDIRLVSRKTRSAVLIELKSSEKREHIEGDAQKALDQIARNNYRNKVSLPHIHKLREYGIASYHLFSHVKGRDLVFAEDKWEEERKERSDDPQS
jgi:hypothetical protein